MHALWPELAPLLEDHYHEIALFLDIPLDVDRAAYEAMQDNGTLRIYTARHNGELIGYAIFFVHHNIHYSSSRQAVQDVLYLDPNYRGSMIAWDLIAYTERELARDGVEVIMHHVKHAHPALGRLLQGRGYTPVETIHVKRLTPPRVT